MDWIGPAVMLLIAGGGSLINLGMQRQSSTSMKESLQKFDASLDRLADDNKQAHQRLHDRVDEERTARSDGYKELADSVAANYVRKDYCELMHEKIPPNGRAYTRERS